jgi:acetoacetyl-CoA synthetase
MSGDILWQASAAQREASALWQFAQNTRAQHGAAPDDYASLHAWSIREPEAFWSAVWDELGIIGQRGERSFAPGAGLRGARFFPQARLNYAENLLREPDARLALIVHREDGSRRSITRAELAAEVSRFAQALRAEGINAGDRVAAIVTHDLEALVGYLACASIGAVWSSCSPDFGPACCWA